MDEGIPILKNRQEYRVSCSHTSTSLTMPEFPLEIIQQAAPLVLGKHLLDCLFPLYFSSLNSFAVRFAIMTEAAMPTTITTGKVQAGLTDISVSAYPAGISSMAHS